MDVETLSAVLDSALKSMQAEGCSLRNFKLERGARCTTIMIEFVHIVNQNWFEVDDAHEAGRNFKRCEFGNSLSSSRETMSDKAMVDGSDNASLTSTNDDSQAMARMCDVEMEPKRASNGRNSVDIGCNTDSDQDNFSIASDTKSTKEMSPTPMSAPHLLSISLHPMNTEPGHAARDTAHLHHNGMSPKEKTFRDTAHLHHNGMSPKEKTFPGPCMPTIHVSQQDMDVENRFFEGFAKSKGRSMSTSSDCLTPKRDEKKRRQDFRNSKQRSMSITIDELMSKDSMQVKHEGKTKQQSSPLPRHKKYTSEEHSHKSKTQKSSSSRHTSSSSRTKEGRSNSSKPPMPVAAPEPEADNDYSDEDEDVLISQAVKKWSAIRGKKGLF